ncbi:class I SAM-dependent methyltransferase [Oceanicaulis sp. MMSF_3324]|uniref:class I SAM-dependent methyltransferase n=1 Tax=Oceanicaulis sp. MMSF_3324 TaxID=3046702 RepID=UPI00273F5A99|nr:class I SAM-dependent methyltransferase [Oceanicaulis sp. MMSF_3324]
MSQDKAFWDRIARKYAQDPIADQASYEHKLEKTRTCFTPDSRVLEYGCGTGATAVLHAPYVKELVATDLSDEMIKIARERAAEAGVDNIRFAACDVADLNEPNGSFDVVLGLNVLHLVPDRQSTIQQSHDLLKPGGAFVTSTACLGDGMAFLGLIKPVMRLFRGWPDFQIFKETRLTEELRASGFIIEYRFKPSKSPTVFLIARKASD